MPWSSYECKGWWIDEYFGWSKDSPIACSNYMFIFISFAWYIVYVCLFCVLLWGVFDRTEKPIYTWVFLLASMRNLLLRELFLEGCVVCCFDLYLCIFHKQNLHCIYVKSEKRNSISKKKKETSMQNTQFPVDLNPQLGRGKWWNVNYSVCNKVTEFAIVKILTTPLKPITVGIHYSNYYNRNIVNII